MTKEEIRKTVLDFYGACFVWGDGLGFPAEKVAEKLYDMGEISYNEMLAFRKEEEEKHE